MKTYIFIYTILIIFVIQVLPAQIIGDEAADFGLRSSADTVAMAWVARYNGPGNDYDEARAIAVDASGNVYVTGWSVGSGTADDYATIKYNRKGEELWVVRYNGPGNGFDRANAIAVDESGNVYVTGFSMGSGTGRDYATIKYNSDGEEQWVARYNGPGNGEDRARAIAVDESGNVYVTGVSSGSGTGWDYATIKYNSEGGEEWIARYNGPGNGDDSAFALDVDASENVYVTGYSLGSGTNYDYATIKYNSEGGEEWVARYNGPGNGWDDARALAVDDSGNVYVTGASFDSGTDFDYATIKYDSEGEEEWVARYNGPGNSNDEAYAIAVDASGNVYVTGWSVGSGTGRDYATIKYNSDGEEQWVARYNGPGNDWDVARAIAVDASGNVYVTGWSWDSGTGNDYATIKYNSEGEEQWVVRYDGPDNLWDEAYALAVDASGNVYVTGWSRGSGTAHDYATIKYVQYVDPPDKVVLAAPEDGGTVGVPEDNMEVQLEWHPSQPGDIYYYLEIATDPEFTFVHKADELTDTVYTFVHIENNQVYYWRVRGENAWGFGEYSDVWSFTTILVSVDDEYRGIPDVYTLLQNYPNPFNPSTTIRYGLPGRSSVKLEIYNTLGQRVATLVNSEIEAGYHEVLFNASHLPSGVYIYRLQAGEFVESKKFLYLK